MHLVRLTIKVSYILLESKQVHDSIGLSLALVVEAGRFVVVAVEKTQGRWPTTLRSTRYHFE